MSIDFTADLRELRAIDGTVEDLTMSPVAPPAPKTGDLWINDSSGYKLFFFNGTSWVDMSKKV